LNNSGNPQQKAPRIIPRAEHNVSRDEISKNALKVLYRLHGAGYQAFLVGGGVRDAILDLHPKDFDIATDATPDEVRALFHNCRLIGRRFRLAHVRFGREVIEVATFRAASDREHDDHVRDEAGRIVRDNVYGTIEEDVWRRDFTCNALYLDPLDDTLLDPQGENYKFFDFPNCNYSSASYDRVMAGSRTVGFSMFGGYSYNERTVLSLGVVDPEVQIGDVLTLVWGEENGGTRKPTVEPHKQLEVRVQVAQAPYSKGAREAYHEGWRTRRT